MYFGGVAYKLDMLYVFFFPIRRRLSFEKKNILQFLTLYNYNISFHLKFKIFLQLGIFHNFLKYFTTKLITCLIQLILKK